jgi:hypothetical protein
MFWGKCDLWRTENTMVKIKKNYSTASGTFRMALRATFINMLWYVPLVVSAGFRWREAQDFTNRLDRLKSRASKFRRPPANLYNTFDTVIELSYLCGPSALYSLNNPSVIFLVVHNIIIKKTIRYFSGGVTGHLHQHALICSTCCQCRI